jgi:hypothetical protein
LYSVNILTADRYSSGAGEWVLLPDRQTRYAIRVVTHPYYLLPQELCVSFDWAVPQGHQGTGGTSPEGIARELGLLVTVLGRNALVPLGVRRLDDKACAWRAEPHPLGSTRPFPRKPPAGIDSQLLHSVIGGLAAATISDIQTLFAASSLYCSGLALAPYDHSVAYVTLVAALECVAARVYRKRQFDARVLPKYSALFMVLDSWEGAPTNAIQIRDALAHIVREEHFIARKLALLLSEYLPESFWLESDTDYETNHLDAGLSRERSSKLAKCLYDARSQFVHRGEPVPYYVTHGMRERIPVEALYDLTKIVADDHLPAMTWVERATHSVIVRFATTVIASDVTARETAERAKVEVLIEVIRRLPELQMASLEVLARWTSRFISYSVCGPLAKSNEWADSQGTLENLVNLGLVTAEGSYADGQSSLRDSRVGEAIGEVVFGRTQNPFRGATVLLPPDVAASWATKMPHGRMEAGPQLGTGRADDLPR